MSVPIQHGAASPMTGRVDFGWLGQAWALFKARWGVWIGAFLLFILISVSLWLLWATATGALATMQQTYLAAINHTAPPVSHQNPYYQFAQTHGFGLLLAAINAVFVGGLFRMALRQARGEEISIDGVFSAFSQALPLAAVAVFADSVVVLLEALLIGLFHLTKMPASQAITLAGNLSMIPTVVLSALLMFAPLLILDRGMSVADAMRGSLRLLKGQWLMGILFYFVAALVGGLGALACGLGILATYPLFFISIAVGYLALTQPPAASPPSGAYFPADAGVWPPPPTTSPGNPFQDTKGTDV